MTDWRLVAPDLHFTLRSDQKDTLLQDDLRPGPIIRLALV